MKKFRACLKIKCKMKGKVVLEKGFLPKVSFGFPKVGFEFPSDLVSVRKLDRHMSMDFVSNIRRKFFF